MTKCPMCGAEGTGDVVHGVNGLDCLRRQLAAANQTIADLRSAQVTHYCANCETQGKEVERLRKDYYELVYEVARVHEGESRHETALRYIREAEAHVGIVESAAAERAGKGEA